MSPCASSILDLGPDTYRKWRNSQLGSTTERLELELIYQLIGEVSGVRVLDIGCGDGLLAVALQQRGAEVVGLDASSAMVEAAVRRAASQNSEVQFQVGRAEKLPYPDSSFDLVVAVTILCFVEEAEHTFREIGRVLRPGGRLVIGELGKRSLWAARRRVKAWLGSSLWQHGRFRTPNELKRLAYIGGLTPDQVHGAIYYPHSDWAARHFARFDKWFSARSTVGAAFLALSASKPE